ncbi:unnamed protein product [Linum tenue]|uniref:Uncharacterized protein n=1 Tax=Linum tenue TaxID=586396 RepID=A0AAV0JV19_9ROSI|nr:unnamed protein product [Linum tenue]
MTGSANFPTISSVAFSPSSTRNSPSKLAPSPRGGDPSGKASLSSI